MEDDWNSKVTIGYTQSSCSVSYIQLIKIRITQHLSLQRRATMNIYVMYVSRGLYFC